MITAADVACVLVTRGDVDLTPILDSLPFDEVAVWDNSQRPFDARVYGRYLAIQETTMPVIAVQDDDCVVRCWDTLLEFYEPGKVVANMVDGHRPGEPPMLGWGALFDRHLPFQAFRKWHHAGYQLDWQMTRYPESIFTALVPCVRLNIGSHADPASKGHEDLPWADAPSRSYRQPNHYAEYATVMARAQAVAAGKVAMRDVRLAEFELTMARTARSLNRV